MSKEYTQKELEIIWENRFKLNSKEMTEVIPGRTPKALKHMIGKLKKVTEEDEKFLISNSMNYPSTEIDEMRNFPKYTSSAYFKMLGVDYVMDPWSYTQDEISTFNKHKNDLTYREIAKKMNVTESRVRNMAYNLGIKTRFYWDDDNVKKLTDMLDNGLSIDKAASKFEKTRSAILTVLRKKDLYDYIPETYNDRYRASEPEKYIMKRIEEEFDIKFPEKNRENKDYYWGIIPPLEVDIPFYMNGESFAIEYDAEYWHSSDLAKQRDEEKKKLLEDKGFHYFVITSDMHKHNNLKTLDPILDMLCQSIHGIVKISERPTTRESKTAVDRTEVDK